VNIFSKIISQWFFHDTSNFIVNAYLFYHTGSHNWNDCLGNSSTYCEHSTALSSSTHCEHSTALNSSTYCEHSTAQSSSTYCEHSTALNSSTYCEHSTALNSSTYCEHSNALFVSHKEGNLLTSWATVTLSKTLIHLVSTLWKVQSKVSSHLQ
jgi:hypothetical protein